MALTDKVVHLSVLSDYLIVMKIQTIVQIIPDTSRYIPHRSGVHQCCSATQYQPLDFACLSGNRVIIKNDSCYTNALFLPFLLIASKPDSF